MTDAQRHPVEGAVVSLQEKSTGANVLQVKTTSAGTYAFPEVAATVYTLSAEKAGSGKAVSASFELKPNDRKQMDLVLQTVAPDFYDEPNFVVAGVTDTSARGGHGSDTVLRSAESLAEATASLSKDTAPVEKQGRAVEVVQGLQRAAERDSSESNLFDWGAELLIHRAAEPAIEVFSKGVRLYPASTRMILGLAAALYSNGSYDQAAQRFFDACDKNAADPAPYLFLGKVRTVAITDQPGYADRMERFAKLQPANAWAQYYYAVSLWKERKRPDEVARLLERAVRLDPTLGVAYLELGILRFDQDNFAAAQAAFEKAIEVAPELEEAHYRLGQTHRRRGDAAAAKKELAIYDEMSKRSAQEAERRRSEMGQFVYELRGHKIVP